MAVLDTLIPTRTEVISSLIPKTQVTLECKLDYTVSAVKEMKSHKILLARIKFGGWVRDRHMYICK